MKIKSYLCLLFFIVFYVGFACEREAITGTDAEIDQSTDNAAHGDRIIQTQLFASELKKDNSASKTQIFSYPESLITKLKLDPSDINKNRDQFIQDKIHIEWMNHVHDVITGLDPQKEDSIIKIHTSLLFIKDRLDKAYFSNKINKQAFMTRLTVLMQWFQQANRSVVNKKEYEFLFGLTQEEKKPYLTDPDDTGLGFPIENPKTTVEMVKKKLDDTAIKKIKSLYQLRKNEIGEIRQIIAEGAISPEEAKHIENDIQATYLNGCRDILTVEQFILIFGHIGDK